MIEVTSFRQQRVAVLGLARSGLAAAEALKHGGADVLAWDDSAEKRAQAAARGLPLVDLAATDLGNIAALVLSPGIPATFPKPHPVAARARTAGIEIIGDIELLARSQLAARYAGITGTNGKSTTTALLGHILAAAGMRVAVGGNLGVPALSLAPLGADGVYALEMSSYQLELTKSLAFDVAILLNITPDHLDRHGGMDGYVAAKVRIFAGQTARQAAVIGLDDDICKSVADKLRAGGHRIVPISAEHVAPGGVYVADTRLIDDLDHRQAAALDLGALPRLPGRHNWQNATAAFAAARCLGVAADVAARAIASFPGLAHRQELIATIDGVRYVNDSKATNADATAKALACYDDICWIAGGVAKEGGIASLAPYFPRIHRAFLIGEAAPAFAATLAGKVPFTRSGDLATAVRQARAAAQPGGTVLLSPACASFDQFTDFEARGEAFRRLVESLKSEPRA
ncbi:MAG TPA: UDP-N-acetylmuramoyl-L-alanine--D-glutamate ligase [Stellaceae bacterium]|jgi:UDP-N-acetylmuramoylalanine--D-glutamate ligase|nr:UDP-N-acetylmuramoyl-L-alanine--D-glutamate ligase [Stellaceae bacterium]